MKSILLVIFILLTSCSTVERYSYFTPTEGADNVDGPEKQYCGIKNFGGEPDLALFNSEYGQINVESNTIFEPYLWGPWLITIIPVFPFYWVGDLVSNPELEINAYSNEENKFLSKTKMTVLVTLDNGVTRSFEGSSCKASKRGVCFRFPIESENVKSFILTISGIKKSEIRTAFKKTSRWAWSQWSPNC